MTEVKAKKFLDSGTSEHDFVRKCTEKIKIIRGLTEYIKVREACDDLQKIIDDYVYQEFKENE